MNQVIFTIIIANRSEVMRDLQYIRETSEDLSSIYEVGKIQLDLIGTDVTLDEVIVTLFQEEVYFVPKVRVNTDLGIDAENMYPILINKSTNETMVDYSNPLHIEKKLQLLLLFAILIYFQDNAKGVRQNVFLNLFKENLIKSINK